MNQHAHAAGSFAIGENSGDITINPIYHPDKTYALLNPDSWQEFRTRATWFLLFVALVLITGISYYFWMSRDYLEYVAVLSIAMVGWAVIGWIWVHENKFRQFTSLHLHLLKDGEDGPDKSVIYLDKVPRYLSEIKKIKACCINARLEIGNGHLDLFFAEEKELEDFLNECKMREVAVEMLAYDPKLEPLVSSFRMKCPVV